MTFPAFCVIAQGSKEIFIGSEHYQYDALPYLLATDVAQCRTPVKVGLAGRLDAHQMLESSIDKGELIRHTQVHDSQC